MTIRSRHAHTCQTRGIAQRKAFHPVLLDQLQRGPDQGCPEVSVMIGALLGGVHGWKESYMNVNPINMYVNLFHMDSRRVIALGYAAAPGLTVLGFIMAADLVFCMLGLVVDHRVITG